MIKYMNRDSMTGYRLIFLEFSQPDLKLKAELKCTFSPSQKLGTTLCQTWGIFLIYEDISTIILNIFDKQNKFLLFIFQFNSIRLNFEMNCTMQA